MTEETLQEAEVTSEGTPPAPETVESSEPTTVEQQEEAKPETPEEEPEATADAAPTWDGVELTAAEGHDKESLTAFGEAAKEQGIAPDAAQKMLDKIVPVLQDRQMKSLDALHTEWIEASKADPEIGGDKFDESLAFALKALDAFGDDGSKKLFKAVTDGGQGLGNQPDLLKMLTRVGKAIGTDTKLVTGSPAKVEVDRAKALFDKSNMN